MCEARHTAERSTAQSPSARCRTLSKLRVRDAAASAEENNERHGNPLPDIIAHRGNAIEFPENTLQALESAVELGLRHVEFDVQLTADHVPVVIHDADLARVGDRPDSVHSLTWPQLAANPGR